MLNFFKTKTFKVGSLVVAFAIALTLTASAATYMPIKTGGVENVKAIQTLVGAVADGKAGPKTMAAIATWQAANGLTADGKFGPASAAKANGGSVSTGGTVALCPNGMTLASNCATAPGTTGGTTGGTLTGGAGSVEDYNLASSVNNEEVGENANDVKVYGLEVEADDSSDLKFTAMKLVFDESTGATSDFQDYADEVSIWLGNTEVARVDGDEFNDDNNWIKTVSFTKDAIIKAGKKDTLYVAVSGISNLDSNDAGDSWTLDVTSARFMDGQGAVTSENPGQGTRTFSFETYSTASNVELKVTEGDEDINDAHIINVDATDDTDNVALLSFEMEAEGDSDIVIDSLPVTVTSTETTGNDPADLISSYSLFAGSTEIGSENSVDAGADSSEVVVFDDLNYTIDAGKTVTFTVKAKFMSIADSLDAGDTIQVTFGETQTDLATFDAEDESGEDLVDNDKTGTVTGDTHEIRDVGFNVKFVSQEAVKSHVGDIANTNDHDEGTFKLTFDVTAFDGDIWLDKTLPDETGGATESDVDVVGTDTYITSSITSPTGATEGTNAFKVIEGETERFTITFVAAAGADGLFQVKLGSILYALTDIDGDLVYNFDLSDYKTAELSLNYDA